MRLTLRTLLAYMDDILDPADQDDLARQVEESEKASELIHRTRDAMRRLRLGAPPVIGEGMELDPNFVAEYLDNTMSSEDMTEFQQVCLDSDVHLAEVASCHHVLTMVLGEPAEIDPAMRQRMYSVPARVDEWRQLRLDGSHQVASAAETTIAPKRTSDSGIEETVTEVPDYLKASDSSAVGRLALAFAAALVLGFGGFLLFGPGGMLRDDAKLAQNEPNQLVAGSETDDITPAEGDTTVNDDTTVVDDRSGTAGDRAADATIDDSAVPGEGVTLPAETNPLPPIGGLETEATDTTTGEAANEAMEAVVVEAPDEVLAGDTGQARLDAAAPDGLATELLADDAAAQLENGTTSDPVDRIAMNTTERTDIMPDVVNENPANAAAETAVPPADTAPQQPAPQQPAPLGTLVAVDQLLLRWDSATGQWLRMPSRAGISAGDQLLSLPTYRPSLALVSGLRVELSDGATVRVDYAADGTTPRLEVTYGRFLLQNTDMAAMEVEIAVGAETKRVVLESTAVLGIDIDRPFVPGADVEHSLGTFEARFYAPEGKVIWNVGENPLPVVTASQWGWDDVAVASMTDDVAWLNGQSLDYLLQNVSRNFERDFDTQRPARLQLLELYESSRRREEKSLAAQCGTHVGQFVPLVQALVDTRQQSNWDGHIADLRRAASRSTQAAELVHETLTEQRGAALADDMFAMLRGYSPEQIGTTRDEVQSGVTRQLIDWLEHDRLEYRVLAIYNLKQIYGGKTLGYNPVVTEPSRQERAVKMWRSRLADNELEPTYLE